MVSRASGGRLANHGSLRRSCPSGSLRSGEEGPPGPIFFAPCDERWEATDIWPLPCMAWAEFMAGLLPGLRGLPWACGLGLGQVRRRSAAGGRPVRPRPWARSWRTPFWAACMSPGVSAGLPAACWASCWASPRSLAASASSGLASPANWPDSLASSPNCFDASAAELLHRVAQLFFRLFERLLGGLAICGGLLRRALRRILPGLIGVVRGLVQGFRGLRRAGLGQVGGLLARLAHLRLRIVLVAAGWLCLRWVDRWPAYRPLACRRLLVFVLVAGLLVTWAYHRLACRRSVCRRRLLAVGLSPFGFSPAWAFSAAWSASA